MMGGLMVGRVSESGGRGSEGRKGSGGEGRGM